jgi:hypothetical protein
MFTHLVHGREIERFYGVPCYSLLSMDATEGYVWEPVELTWSQKLAAFWTVGWPAQVASFLVAFGIAGVWDLQDLRKRTLWVGLAASVVYLIGLGRFAPRLVRKRYRSFRIAVERGNGATEHELSRREAFEVAVPLIALQALFVAALSVVYILLSHVVKAEQLRDLQSLALWGRVLVVGPYSVRWAIAFRYQGFHLRAYALKIAPTGHDSDSMAAS